MTLTVRFCCADCPSMLGNFQTHNLAQSNYSFFKSSSIALSMAGVIFPPDIGAIIFSDMPLAIAICGLLDILGKCFSRIALLFGSAKRSPIFESIVRAMLYLLLSPRAYPLFQSAMVTVV